MNEQTNHDYDGGSAPGGLVEELMVRLFDEMSRSH